MLRQQFLALLIVGFALAPTPWIHAQQASAKQDAEAILDKTRETYRKVRGFHFDHTIVVEIIASDDKARKDKARKIAEVTLITASEKDKGPPKVFRGRQPADSWTDAQRGKQVPVNLDRCRFEVKHRLGDVVLVSDGKASSMFIGKTKEYKQGKSTLDVTGPTSAAMQLALHFQTLQPFFNDSLQSPKFLREEEIQVGEEGKACFVIEARIKSTPPPIPEGVELPTSFPKDRNPLAGANGFLMQMMIHGMVEFPELPMVAAPGDESATPREKPEEPEEKAELPRITLWIDQQDSVVWKTRMVEKPWGPTPAAGEEIELTDTFAIAKIDRPLPAELFQFTPPPDAQEVREFTRPATPQQEKRK